MKFSFYHFNSGIKCGIQITFSNCIIHNRLIKNNNIGFSLLEISFVLIIIALVTAMGLSVGPPVIEAANVKATNNRLDAIEKALVAYRVANNRIPCPADGTLTPTNSNYGVEAANAGTCTGGTPAANFSDSPVSVEGVVPVRTLGLPDQFMYDGWGRKIAYAPTLIYTGNQSFKSYGAIANCGRISVTDANGSGITSNALYVLLSYGANGHGGYDDNGYKVSNLSQNFPESKNCHCDNTDASDTGYQSLYYMLDPAEDIDNAYNSYDDIVRYKERWQMQAYSDEVNPGGDLICPSKNKGLLAEEQSNWNNTGRHVATADINGDGINDLMVLSASKVYVLFGALDIQSFPSLTALDGKNGFTIIANGVGALSAVESGDINNDGIKDIIVGAWDSDIAIGNGGSTYIIYGKTTAWAASFDVTSLDGTNGFRIDGTTINILTGYSITTGDINGDGKTDIAIAAWSANYFYVVYGASSFPLSVYTLNNHATTGLIDTAGTKGFTITGTGQTRITPHSLAMSDINGDGIDDLIIGDYYYNTLKGRVSVFYGRKGTWPASTLLASINGVNGFYILGNGTNQYVGHAVSAGDINGDGINDIIVGAYRAGYSFSLSGSAFVVFGTTAKKPKTFSLTLLNGINGFRVDGAAASDNFGDVFGIGDVNGDGITDLVAGVGSADPGGNSGAGSTYVIFGRRGTSWSPTTDTVTNYMNGTLGFQLDGEAANDNSGDCVKVADLNGDGRDDIAIGAPYANSLTYGNAYVYFSERKSSGYTNPVALSTLR